VIRFNNHKYKYDPFPQYTNGYNSNSYTSGLLSAAGLIGPTFGNDEQFPGFSKPIPTNGFQ
jgi:hypothetical protein